MEIFSTSVSAASMMYDTENNMYYGTILAENHGFGSDAFVVRAVHRDSDLSMENVLCAYKVESNGDVKVYVDEPTSIRITIGKGVPSATANSILGEGEEYADS